MLVTLGLFRKVVYGWLLDYLSQRSASWPVKCTMEFCFVVLQEVMIWLQAGLVLVVAATQLRHAI